MVVCVEIRVERTLRDTVHCRIISKETRRTHRYALIQSLIEKRRHLDWTSRDTPARNRLSNKNIRAIKRRHAHLRRRISKQPSSATFGALPSVIVRIIVRTLCASRHTSPCGVITPEIGSLVAQRNTIFSSIIRIVPSGTVFRASPVQSLCKSANRTLSHTIPSTIISKIPRRTLVHTSCCRIVTVLLSTAVDHTPWVENITIGQLSCKGTCSYTTLGYVLCEVECTALHWTCSHA